jgi:hypothetical protein
VGAYAKKNNVSRDQVDQWSVELWGKSFVEQRDEEARRRGAPDEDHRSRAAYRANVTSAMYRELDGRRLRSGRGQS